jgi:hypothetical protein
MTPARAIWEFRCLGCLTLPLLEKWPDDELACQRAHDLSTLLKATDNFQPTLAQVKEWEAERRMESGWIPCAVPPTGKGEV